jgi:hypothetical protein
MFIAFILALLTVTPAMVSAEEQEGFKSIFDGKTLDGWKGLEKFWSVRDGAITGETTSDNPAEGNTFLVLQGMEPGDFELRCKFRIVGHNSGIQYRSELVDAEKFVVKGYQADIDASHQYIGINYGERTGRGVIGDRGKKIVYNEKGEKEVVGDSCDEQEFLKSVKKEDWNEYVIVAKGNHLIHKINGFVTSDVTDNHKDAAKSGIIALQLHAGPPMVIQFKDIQLKELK